MLAFRKGIFTIIQTHGSAKKREEEEEKERDSVLGFNSQNGASRVGWKFCYNKKKNR